MSVTEIVALASLALNIGIVIAGATVGISKIRSTVQSELFEHRSHVENKINEAIKNNGEGLTAVRTKIHELETWARDEFVRKGSFEIVISRLERTFKERFDNLDRNFERMEDRLNKRDGVA